MKSTQNTTINTDIRDRVLPRFIQYVQYWTTSDRHIEETPSSPGQWELAKALVEELKQMGPQSVELTDHCYVVARFAPSKGGTEAPTIGFMAHLDTSNDVSGQNVKPQITKNYDGSTIPLAEGRVLDPAQDSELLTCLGHDIVHSDGTTLLGADDKAGIAEIMGALEYLHDHPELERGPIEVIFTPDEETGKGLPHFPSEKVKSSSVYTLDGGPAGELEVECFNAYKADIDFVGKPIHIGYARGKLANALLMAATYATLLPRSESPEATDGYYGYYSPMEIRGDLEKAYLEVYIRDFDLQGAQRRLAVLDTFAKTVEAQFPGGSVRVQPKLLYYNMKKKIDEHPKVLELLQRAAEKAKVAIYLKPIRGGTDGARLTEMGIPSPNVFAGGRNFHSHTEWASVNDMVAATATVIELIQLWAREKTI
jgi:tripeptide aminopeptidase